MMWGAISWNQRTPLVLVPNNLMAQMYRNEIIQPHLLPVINIKRESFSATTTDRTQHLVLSNFLLITTSLHYPGHPDPRIWIPLSISGINWRNVCACVNQPRKVFCNYNRHYKRNGKDIPGLNSTFNLKQYGLHFSCFFFTKMFFSTKMTKIYIMVFKFLLDIFLWKRSLKAVFGAKLNYCRHVQKLISYIFLRREIFSLTKTNDFFKSYLS